MKPRFDVWVCQGRMCTANGSDALAAHARAVEGERCRVLRGGCYGLCEIGPNVVVRRHDGALPDPEADRLSLTDAANEHVYSQMTPPLVESVVHSHLAWDLEVPEVSREARERDLPPAGPVAAKLRRLRERRKLARG